MYLFCYTSKSFSVYDIPLIFFFFFFQTGLQDGYCGRQDPITITETTKRLLIKFVSDGTRNAPGFNATFNIQITQGKTFVSIVMSA